MVDIVDKIKRSEMMRGIKGANTAPEINIRKGLHKAGLRFRLKNRHIPGNPDIVLPKYNAVIFINGCFWHQHNCHLFKWPSTRTDFWKEKISGNAKRDLKNLKLLKEQNWRVLTVWECAIKGKTRLPNDNLIQNICEWLLSSEAVGTIHGIDY